MKNPFRGTPPEFKMLRPQFEESLTNVLINAFVAACTVLEKHFGFTKEQIQEFATHWDNEMDWLAKTQKK